MDSLLLQVVWLLGFSSSTLGLIFQALIFFLIPCSRQLDQKILTQLTVARLLNIALEYTMSCVELKNVALNHIVFALYAQTDAALICWMFVFTKNLYDAVMNALAPKSSFTLMSVIIWCVTIPVGLLCPLLMELSSRRRVETGETGPYFKTFYAVYAYVKFTILGINLILFIIIFMTAISRKDRVVSLLRTCVVSFVLVSISSLQVFLTDLLSNFLDKYPNVSLSFAVVNSYQVLAITAVFVILVQKNCKDESFKMKITKKFIRQTV